MYFITYYIKKLKFLISEYTLFFQFFMLNKTSYFNFSYNLNTNYLLPLVRYKIKIKIYYDV